MTAWSWLCATWAAMFIVVEGATLKNKKPGDTLSDHVWQIFAIGRPGNRPKFSGQVQLCRFVLLAGMAWLTTHFLTGGAV